MKYVTRKRLKVVAIVALALVLAAGIVASGFAIAEVAIEGKYEFLSYDGSKGGDRISTNFSHTTEAKAATGYISSIQEVATRYFSNPRVNSPLSTAARTPTILAASTDSNFRATRISWCAISMSSAQTTTVS